MQTRPTPTGILVSALFFAVSGLLELGLGVLEAPRPLPFWTVWEALGRAILYWLLAAGLWHRLALCRQVAVIYCLATLVTYGIVLGLAFGLAPLQFPSSVVVSSIFQVPSCALLFPYLRSGEATLLFQRALFPK
jgi:hypothetical protein